MEVKRPKIGLAALVIQDGKILLGKRKNAHGAETYAPSGGHLEFGESPEDGITREVLEEIGVNVVTCEFFDLTSDIFDSEKHYITLYYKVNIDGEPMLCEPNKCEGWEWFDVNKLPENLFLPIKNLLKKRKL